MLLFLLLLVEPGNSDDQCLPEDEKVDETTSSNEEEGLTLDPIDGLVRGLMFLFLSLVPWYLNCFEICKQSIECYRRLPAW